MNTSLQHSMTSGAAMSHSARATASSPLEVRLATSSSVTGAQGFYNDVTPSEHAHQVAISEAVAEIAENRAVIEQVKGILCLVYRIEADAAFEFLRWRYQDTNVKLRAPC
jgi:ANTAR domain